MILLHIVRKTLTCDLRSTTKLVQSLLTWVLVNSMGGAGGVESNKGTDGKRGSMVPVLKFAVTFTRSADVGRETI